LITWSASAIALIAATFVVIPPAQGIPASGVVNCELATPLMIDLRDPYDPLDIKTEASPTTPPGVHRPCKGPRTDSVRHRSSSRVRLDWLRLVEDW